MTTRRLGWAVAVVVVVGAIAVYVASLPDEYGCEPSLPLAIPRGKVTSVDGRNVTCVEAARVMRALFRGEGHPSPGSDAATVRGWRCVSADGLASCTRGRDRWIRAHYTFDH